MRVENISISSISIPEDRFRQSHDVSSLAESIKHEGLHQPIIVNEKEDGHTLISGLHRLRAFVDLGYEEIPASVRTLDETRARLAEISENLQRYQMTTIERARAIDEQDKLLAALGMKKGVGRPRKSEAADSDTNELVTRNRPIVGRFSWESNAEGDLPADSVVTPFIGNEELARSMGMSESGAKDYRKIARDIAAPLHKVIRTMEIGNNLSELRRLSRLDHKDQIFIVTLMKSGEANGVRDAQRRMERGKTKSMAEHAEPPPLESGPFKTIIVDPPWSGRDTGDLDPFGKLEPDYATMDVKQIKDLPVADLADPEDCHLYLWVTGRSMALGFEIMEHWGFKYIQPLVWVKHRLGTGHYFRNQAEYVLFGVRGSRLLTSTRQSNVFHGKRREHSRKPDEFYELVRECSTTPALEMFQREEREGFYGWGAEISRFTDDTDPERVRSCN